MRDALLHAIGVALDGLEVGFCAFDQADRTLAWNASFLALFPEHAGHVHVGEPYADGLRRFYQDRLTPAQLPHLERFIAEGVARHRNQRRPFEFNHHDARIRVSAFDLGRQGRVRVWRKVATLPARLERPGSMAPTLSESNALAALERLADGVVIVDVADRVLWANRAFLDLYGMRDVQAIVGQPFEAIYRAAWADRTATPGCLAGLLGLRDRLGFCGAPFELELPDDRFVRVVEQRGEVDGRGYFVHVDITHLKRQQAALAQAEARYRLLAEYSSDIILTIEGGMVRYVSPAVTEVLGWTPQEVTDRPLADFRHPQDTPRVAAALLSLRRHPEADYRSRVRHRDGHYVWMEARVRALPAATGDRGRRYIINARNITARKSVEDELEQAKQRLQQLATTDALTGLANRRRLDEVLALEFRRAQREGQPLALLVLDIDHFKQFNDTHGHQAGDAVLRMLGQLLAQFPQRAGDLAARLGGEEFVLLLQGCEEAQAAGVAERLRLALAQLSCDHGPVTVSIGVAAGGPGGPASGEALLALADQALYAAKRGGRNRCARASMPEAVGLPA